MKAIQLASQSAEEIAKLDEIYRKSKHVHFKQRVQIVLLALEKGLVAAEIGEIVRLNEQTVRRWLKRYQAEGLEGLKDKPRPGAKPVVTPAYRDLLLLTVRKRPRSMGLDYSMWTCQRLADYLAEETGIRVSDETVRQYLAQGGIVLSRPQHKISSPDPEYELKKRRLKSKGQT